MQFIPLDWLDRAAFNIGSIVLSYYVDRRKPQRGFITADGCK